MNPSLLIGNLCSLIGTGADTLSTTRKTPQAMLWLQSLGQLLYGIGTFVLGGYSGVVQNVVSILRNLVAIRGIRNPILEWILLGMGVVLGIAFNNLGTVGFLPVLGNLQYTLAIFRSRDNERALKISFAIMVLAYAVFNFAIYNFVGAAMNLVILATTITVLLRSREK